MTAEQSKELLLSVQGLKKNFGEREILKGIDFDVHKGDVVCVIGPSGSGKSTLIRCVNYLEQPTDGVIGYRGENVLECFKNLPLYRTKVGMVFQQFNLFNNMTVLENCVVGQVKVLGKKSEEAKAIAMKYLEHVGMASYINAKPHQLSGGQKQRAAIASAIASGRSVLFLDEPTNDLDIQTLQILEDYLDTFPGIVITVSHDRYFLDRVVNRIFAFEGNGVVQQYEGGFTDYQRAWNERHPQISGNGAGAGNAGSGKASDKDTDEENAANAKAVNKNNWKETSGAQKKLRLSYKEQREWETIEGDIAGLEEAIAALETEIEKSASNYTRLNELMKEKTEKEAQLEEKMDRWMYLTDLVEQIESQK